MNHKELILDERWLVSSSAQNAAQLQHEDEDEDEDEEEALSLSDLPLIHQWRKENQNNDDDDNNNNNSLVKEDGHDQEFDFCSFSKESEMCAADEIFFKGQILPLRHSVSSEKGLLRNYDGGGYQRRSFSRSDSMDHYYSSRSSSISSHQSSTSSGSGSGSSSATAATAAAAGRYKPKLPPRIQFHSHPSPSPRLHFPSNRQGGAAVNHRNSISKSSIWNVLRLGLVTPLPAEITFKDLKARSTNSGSRNSTSSNSSGGGASTKKKMRPRILGGGGCTCAADAVETAAPRVVIIKRSACESESDGGVMHDRSGGGGGEKLRKKQAAKKVLSQNRTFEWLKQLSVEGAADQ